MEPDERADDVAHALTERGAPDTIPERGSTTDPLPGDRIGRFTVIEILGQGGMGVVVSARDPDLDRRVAIKLVRTAEGDTEARESRGRAVREARAMAKLRHRNVVSVYEVGTYQDAVFVAMEQIHGGTLRDEIARLSADGPPHWRTVLKLFQAAGRGLQAAHEAGMIHRDFKPENVLVDTDGRVVVGDFGLVGIGAHAAPAASFDTSGQLITEPLTRADEVFGTPAYMPPEQHTGDALDERADQFAFCVALYEALYGELPFEGKTRVEYVDSVRDQEIKPPAPGRKVPSWLRKTLRRGMSAKPEDRYPSMKQLLVELGTGRDAERQIGDFERTLAWAIAGLALVGWVIASVELGVELSFEFHLATDLGFFALFLVIGWIGRPVLRTKLNSQLYFLGMSAVVAVTGMTVGCELLGVPAMAVAVLHLAILACFSGAGMILVDKRMGFICIVYTAAFFAAAAMPHRFFFVSLLAHPTMAVIAYWIFRAPRA